MSASASPSPRFGHWVLFFIASVVTLGAAIEARAHSDRLSAGARANQTYAVACCAIAFLLSTAVVALHTRPLMSSVVLGTKLEGGAIFALLALWSALVSIVSDTRHGLATDASGSVSNGNLYYFSWAGLALGVTLMLSFVRSVWGFDLSEELRNRAKRLNFWVWLGVVGLVQMGSSARLFDNHCGSSNPGLGEWEMGSVKFCKRCKLGIVLGITSTVASMVVAGLKMGMIDSNKVTLLYMAELVLSCLMALLQAVGVAFLTSQEGPGAPLNNLFHSTWGSLAVALILAASCIDDWSEAKRSGGFSERESVFSEEEQKLTRRTGSSSLSQ